MAASEAAEQRSKLNSLAWNFDYANVGNIGYRMAPSAGSDQILATFSGLDDDFDFDADLEMLENAGGHISEDEVLGDEVPSSERWIEIKSKNEKNRKAREAADSAKKAAAARIKGRVGGIAQRSKVLQASGKKA